MEKRTWIVEIKCSEFETPIEYRITEVARRPEWKVAELAQELADHDHKTARHEVLSIRPE